MQVERAIQTKRAVRQYEDRPISEASLKRLLNAGRRAQSAKNRQPWDFIVVRQRQHLIQLAESGTYAAHLAGAALAIVIVTPDPSERWSILFDAGQAAAYMQLAAWSEGIASCPATIYDQEAARELLAIPAGKVVHIAFSFGYPADPSDLTRPSKRGGRRSFDDVVHWEHW
jgi:nitroreductase